MDIDNAGSSSTRSDQVNVSSVTTSVMLDFSDEESVFESGAAISVAPASNVDLASVDCSVNLVAVDAGSNSNMPVSLLEPASTSGCSTETLASADVSVLQPGEVAYSSSVELDVRLNTTVLDNSVMDLLPRAADVGLQTDGIIPRVSDVEPGYASAVVESGTESPSNYFYLYYILA